GERNHLWFANANKSVSHFINGSTVVPSFSSSWAFHKDIDTSNEELEGKHIQSVTGSHMLCFFNDAVFNANPRADDYELIEPSTVGRSATHISGVFSQWTYDDPVGSYAVTAN